MSHKNIMRLKKHPLPFAVSYLDIKQNHANTSVFETKHPSCVQCEKPAACYYCPSITTLFCSVITARLSLLDPTYRPLAYKRGFFCDTWHPWQQSCGWMCRCDVWCRDHRRPSKRWSTWNFVITEKAFSLLKAATTAITFKTLCYKGVDPMVSKREIGSPMQLS